MPDRYSSQYREMVLAQIRAGTPVAEVAAGLEVSEATVYRWRHQDRVDRGEVAGTSSVEHAELAAARRRIGELEAELAATRRASVLFDQGRVVHPKDLYPIVEQLDVEGHGLKAVRGFGCRLGLGTAAPRPGGRPQDRAAEIEGVDPFGAAMGGLA